MTYVLSARGLDVQRDRLEMFRRDMEDDPNDRAIRRFSNAELAFREADGYRAESDVYRILAGLGLPADRALVALDVLSGGERRRVELAHILFGGTDNLVLDEPTNHLDADATQLVDGFPARVPRRAARGEPRPRASSTRPSRKVLHLDRESEAPPVVAEYKGTYSQYVAARSKRRGTTSTHRRRVRHAEIGRLSTLADRCSATRAPGAPDSAKTLDKRVERLAADAGHADPRRAAR